MNFRSLFYSILLLIFLAGPRPVFAQESVKESEQLEFAQGLLSRGMYDMAILQYQKFIADYPKSASLQDAYLSLGEVYFLSQDFNKAIDAFNQFNQLYPKSEKLPESILRLGQIDIQQKKFDEAIKELTSIDAQQQLKGPMLQAFDYYKAQAYLGKVDNVSALDYFQKAVGVDGAFTYTPYAYEKIGQIQSQNGNYSDAMNAYTKSMRLVGDDVLKGELVYRTAEVQFLSGQYPDAIKGFEQVIDQYSSLGFTQDALANLLLAYYNLGQYDQLLSEYQKDAHEIKDEEPYFQVHFAAVLAFIELKKYDQANMLLDKILSFPSLKSQETARIFIKKADILIRQKKYKDGMALLEAYSSQNTDNADENYFLKAEAYYGLGDYDKAFSFFENVYLNYPNSRFLKAALLGQAHARQEKGRYKESAVLFLKYYAIQDDPHLKSDALYDAVKMALKAGDDNAAINNAQEYLKTFPQGEHCTEVLFILADSYGNNNSPQEAVKLLQGYLSKPDSAQNPNTANFLLGFNQQLSGHIDQALAAYGQVDELKEGGKFYDAALKNMAIIYLNQKNAAQATVYFDKLISRPEKNDLQIKTYIWVCNEYLKQQKYDDVLRIVAQAEKNFSAAGLLPIQYFKAEALRGKGSCDDAIKDYALVTASAEKDVYTASAHIGYGLCLAQANKFDEAKVEFQKSMDENPDDYTVGVHARFEMANADFSQGNFDEALKYYLLIASIYDDQYYCSESLLQAGKIFEKNKRPADALKVYAEILEKYKNSKVAGLAAERARVLK